MSQTTPPMTPAAAPAGPVAAPHGPRERRIRFGHLALAIALVVVGALGTTALVTMVSATDKYLALARDVEYGAQITEADLTVVSISSPPGLDPWPASERNRAIGNVATMPLAKGTLLTAAHVTDQQLPAAGEVRLGITVPGERLPAQPVRSGNLILLVDTGQGSNGGTTNPDPRTWQGTVLRVSDDGSGGGILGGGRAGDVTIDVVISAADAPMIAALAANDLLSVAVLPGQPGS
ncbi:MAG: hypothetical protein GEV12_05955 [Micromonosporaceae bacterium]|nr:hypothetical protein [Micromonosporaceae bacterium]